MSQSPAKHTWTAHTFYCHCCHRVARASAEAIASEREHSDCDGMTDADIAASFDYCLECCDGVIHEGEHVNANTGKGTL